MKLFPCALVALAMVARSAMAMPSTTTIHLIGIPDKGRTSDQLVHGVAPVPLSSRATEDASQ